MPSLMLMILPTCIQPLPNWQPNEVMKLFFWHMANLFVCDVFNKYLIILFIFHWRNGLLLFCFVFFFNFILQYTDYIFQFALTFWRIYITSNLVFTTNNQFDVQSGVQNMSFRELGSTCNCLSIFLQCLVPDCCYIFI